MGCENSRVKELEADNKALADQVEFLKQMCLGDDWEKRKAIVDRRIANREDLTKGALFDYKSDGSNWDADMNGGFVGKSREQLMDEALQASAEDTIKAAALQAKIVGGKLQYLNDPALEEEKKAVEEVFRLLDADGSGSISKAELLHFFPKGAHIFESCDYDHDGSVSAGEFMTRMDEMYGKKPASMQGFLTYLTKTVEAKKTEMEAALARKTKEAEEAKTTK